MIPLIEAHRAEISELCRRFQVRHLELFGSAARASDFNQSSDLDFLVDYEITGTPPSLANFLSLREALSSLLGRKVDLTMAGSLRNPFLRAAIERSAETVHGA
jgi:predicted nucleotidyltransferase